MKLKPTPEPEQKLIVKHRHGHPMVNVGTGCVKTSTLGLRAKHLIETECEKTEIQLTKEQIKIIAHAQGPAIVKAGPGTGKTQTLCQTIKKLVDQGCCPENIQVLTFSKVANKNFKDRLGNDPRYSKVRASTFHSFGLRIIKENWRAFGFSMRPNFISKKNLEIELDNIVGKIAVERGIRKVDLRKSVDKAFVQRNKNTIKSKSTLPKAAAVAVKELQNYKLINNFVDYEDMLNLVAERLERDPDLVVKAAATIEHLLVDELQDISDREVKLIYNLAKRVRSTLMVGDQKQAIYKFRGSDLKCWSKLEALLSKKLRHYSLTKTFRLPEQALPLVNAVAADINDDLLLTSDRQGFVPHLFIAESNDEQSAFVAKEIKKLLARGVDPKDIVILGRTIKTLYSIKNHLSHLGIDAVEDYRKSRATTEKVLRALIRITQCLARSLINKDTFILPKKSSYKLVKYLGLSEEIVDKVYGYVMEKGWNSLRVPKKACEKEGIYRGINSLKETVVKAAALEPEAGTQLLIDALSPFIHHRFGKEKALIKRDLSETTIKMRAYNSWSEVDLNKIPFAYSKSGVQLYKIHGAKGKEWKYVFLINVVEKYLPFSFNGNCDLDEERRLFYVAITRAIKRVYIIHSPVIGTAHRNKGKQIKTYDKESAFISSYQEYMKPVK